MFKIIKMGRISNHRSFEILFKIASTDITIIRNLRVTQESQCLFASIADVKGEKEIFIDNIFPIYNGKNME